MTTEYPRGSEWRQCDLHIHTPFSRETNYGSREDKTTWDKFIADIEENYEIGSIIGICDYNTFSGYFKIKKDYPDFFKKYAILPVIELRTDDYVGKKAELKINLHIIFSKQIEDSELNRLLDYPLTRGEIKINDIKDFNSETICIEKLKKFFSDNAKYYNNKYLFMLGRNEANEIDNGLKGNFMKDAQFICSASENVEQAQKAQSDTQQYFDEYNIKYFHCSDAHSFSSNESEITRKIGHCYTWIKGSPSFETLRQAFFSYDSRIKIQKTKPLQAVNVLDDVEIKLPTDTKIGDNDCCFAGTEYHLQLNPALNCFIGGRGTGKSLLLQLMCKKNLEQISNDDDKNIVNKIRPGRWDDYVTIDGIEFEYFGQGKIEKFYENKVKFQESISNRLNKFWTTENFVEQTVPPSSKLFKDAIDEKMKPLEELIKCLQNQINIVSEKIGNDLEIDKIKKEMASRIKIVEACNDANYTKLSEENNLLIKKEAFLKNSKTNLENLLANIKNICTNFKKINKEEYDNISYYAEKYNKIIDELHNLLNLEDSIEKNVCDTEEIKLFSDLQTSENSIKQYFLDRGMSKANVDDLARAQQDITNYKSQLSALEEKNNAEEAVYEDLKQHIETANLEYNSRMNTILSETQAILKSKGNKEISNLTFEYKYDKAQMFSDFAKFIKDKTGINEGDFKSVLNKRYADNELVFADELEAVCLNEAKSSKSAEKIIKFLYSNQRNRQLYNLNCLLCLNDSIKYEIFNTMYQGKNLEDLSFGQRATAIVLTLLLFGNKPLIIDEPETHLDQRFIANDLVNIIKQVKNDKQIIFATHNANIVINSDAEQIFILKMEDNNKTIINQMTIEDVYDQKKKEELLLLEGSLEAFKKREKKYVI